MGEQALAADSVSSARRAVGRDFVAPVLPDFDREPHVPWPIVDRTPLGPDLAEAAARRDGETSYF